MQAKRVFVRAGLILFDDAAPQVFEHADRAISIRPREFAIAGIVGGRIVLFVPHQPARARGQFVREIVSPPTARRFQSGAGATGQTVCRRRQWA